MARAIVCVYEDLAERDFCYYVDVVSGQVNLFSRRSHTTGAVADCACDVAALLGPWRLGHVTLFNGNVYASEKSLPLYEALSGENFSSFFSALQDIFPALEIIVGEKS